MIRKSLFWFMGLVSICFSCSSLKAKYGLTNGSYDFKQPGEAYRKVELFNDSNDSIRVFEQSKPATYNIKSPLYFRQQTLDVDALIVPFKFRPGSSYLPRQLTTDFNGNIYVGYRVDRFKLTYSKTPLGDLQKQVKHVGFGGGIFGGLGSTAVTPWTTTDPLFQDEYNGLVLSHGLALLMGVKNLTFGVGVGWDFLTDRDKDIWIYQNKPWYGLTVGLNVN